MQKLGILHGAAAYGCQDKEGQIKETESFQLDLIIHQCPIHCFLKEMQKEQDILHATDEEALDAYKLVTKYEKLIPSLNLAHAFAEAIKIAPNLKKYNHYSEFMW